MSKQAKNGFGPLDTVGSHFLSDYSLIFTPKRSKNDLKIIDADVNMNICRRNYVYYV